MRRGAQPGGEPASPLANGGAFGGKASSIAPAAARALADEHGRPVRVLLSREDAVRLGPKRPPIAAGVRADGTGVVRVVATPGHRRGDRGRLRRGLVVEEVDVAGPADLGRSACGAGWAEAMVLVAGARGHVRTDRRTQRRAGRGVDRRRRSGAGVGQLRRGARRGRAALVLHRRRRTWRWGG